MPQGIFFMKKTVIFLILLMFVLLNKTAFADETVFFSERDFSKTNPHTKRLSPQILKMQIDVTDNITRYFDDGIVPVDMKDCIIMTLSNNYDIKIVSKTQEQQKWLYYNKLSEFMPNFYYNYNISDLRGEFLVGNVLPRRIHEIAMQNVFGYGWVVFDGGKRFFNAKAQKDIYRASAQDKKMTQEKAILTVVEKYNDLLAKKLSIEVYERNLIQTQAQLELNKNTYEIGVGNKFDVVRSEAEVESAKQKLVEAYNSFRLAQVSLASFMGSDSYCPVFPVEDDIVQNTILDTGLTLEKMEEVAFENRSDLKSLELKISSLKNQKKTILSSFAPTISIDGAYSYVGTVRLGSRPNHSIALDARWALGKGLGTYEYTQMKAAQAEIDRNVLELDHTKNQIKEDLINTYYSIATAKQTVEAARRQVVAADESLRIAFGRLESGVGIYIDVLQAQASEVEAKINLINAIVAYNNLQIKALYDMGIISVCNSTKGYIADSEAFKKYLEKKGYYLKKRG